LTLAGTSSTTKARAVMSSTYGLPRKWRMVSMNLPTEIGFDR
jgi:hypothetical protein